MKTTFLTLALATLMAVASPLPVQATTVHLDGIANAGWYADDLTKAHLYITDLDNPNSPYYQWTYSAPNPTPLWNSRQALADDLADGVLVNGTVVNNWHVESAGDVFNNPAAPIFKTLPMDPGTYILRLTNDSRAYQLNEFLWPNETAGNPVWNAYVQMYAAYNDGTGESFNFGDWSHAEGAESQVLTGYRQAVDNMLLILDKPATMLFYINDYNAVDNGASVTLEFTKEPPQTPLPGSLMLFGSGLAAWWTWRRRGTC